MQWQSRMLLGIGGLMLCLTACKTTNSKLSSDDASLPAVNAYEKIENDTVRKLWLEHIRYETVEMNSSGREIQADCQPRFYPSTASNRRGMVVFFHGFTACPQQYFDIAVQLSARGFDVFLPLMPGQGRSPDGSKDHLQDLPSKATQSRPRQHPRYVEFISKMNELAAASTGEKVLAGLSGGGGLATGAAVAAAAAPEPIWSRLLLYAPYYRNPGMNKVLADTVGFFNPGVRTDWGDGCRKNRSRPQGRNGYCSVTVGATQAMVQFGEQAAEDIAAISIPVQFVGVEEDPTADNQAMYAAFKRLSNAQFCVYPSGVPHSIINPDQDLIPDTEEFASIREEGLPSGPPYEWVNAMQRDSINFLVEGNWFPQSSPSTIEARFGNEFAMCEPSQLTR